MNEPIITFDMIFGRVQLDDRLVPNGDRWVGQGRCRTYGANGQLVEDTGWIPTGVEAWLE